LQCKRCGKPFLGAGGKFCPACLDKIEEDLETVRVFVRAHPDEGSVPEISEKTGVPQSIILYLLKENRLSTTADDTTLRCELCKQPLQTGRFCAKCKNLLVDKIDGARPKPASPEKRDAARVLQSKIHINRKD
jgi:hypothetical protein